MTTSTADINTALAPMTPGVEWPNAWNQRTVIHVYRLRDGLVDHMEIREG